MKLRFTVIGFALTLCAACVGPAQNGSDFPPMGTTKEIQWLEAREARRAEPTVVFTPE